MTLKQWGALGQVLRTPVDAVLVQMNSRKQGDGEAILKDARLGNYGAHVICFDEGDFEQLLGLVANFKAARAEKMPGCGWFFNNDPSWMNRVIATAMLLNVLKPNFCASPPITF